MMMSKTRHKIIFFAGILSIIHLFACYKDSNVITNTGRQKNGDNQSNIFYAAPYGANDSTAEGSESYPFGSVTFALNEIKKAGLDSATLIIKNGRYSPSLTGETFPLYLSSNLKIIAEERIQTIIDGEDSFFPMMNFFNNENILVRGLLFENGTNRAIAITMSTSIIIDSCIFINFKRPPQTSLNSVITLSDLGEGIIANNVIMNNELIAIEIGPMYAEITPQVYNNKILNNKAGIKIYLSNALIGTQLSLANDIYSNFDYNLNATENVYTINARNNYWGSTDTNIIEQTLKGPIDWIPFTNAGHTVSIYGKHAQ
jgi:hypothetical protein